MSNTKTLVKVSRNREVEFESVFGQNQSSFRERLRMRRLRRNNQGEINNIEEGNDLNNTIDRISNVNSNSSIEFELLSDTSSSSRSDNEHNLIELFSEIGIRSEDEDIDKTTAADEETTRGDITEDILDEDITEELVDEDLGVSLNVYENNNIFQRDLNNILNDNNILQRDLDNMFMLNGNNIQQRDLMNPAEVYESIHRQNILEHLAESNDHIDRATNLLELAQIQNRWVLFGLGAGFIVLTGLPYWIGYRLGRSSVPIPIPENTPTIDYRARVRSLRIIWNLLIDRFKW